MTAEDVALGTLPHERRAPSAEGMDDGRELSPARRQSKERGRNRRRRSLSRDEARLLELAEAVSQEIRGDPGQPIAQVGVARAFANEELADDQQCPPISDE